MIVNKIKKKISHDSIFRLLYHKLIAIIACFRNNFPADDMVVIGITGTNGKTTVANLIFEALEKSGKKTALISTVKFMIGKEEFENKYHMTFPKPAIVQKFLAKALEKKCKYAVIEVTSHSISQHRIWGINFDYMIFTNLSQDHIDYHGSYGNYKRTKGKIFSKLITFAKKPHVQKTSILNRNDKEYNYFNSFPAEKKISYGIEKGDVCAKNLILEPTFSRFICKTISEEKEITLKIPGKFNIENALACIATITSLGISLNTINNSFFESNFGENSGRFEFINCGQNFTCVVDFAHTPDALEKLLMTFEETCKIRIGKIYLIFGATGDRDKSKRKIMGEIANKYSDFIVLTSDDPHSEDPIEIINQVASGINRKEGEDFWIIENRKTAIKFVIENAKISDIIIIAGKGAEKFQILNGEKIEHDDRKVAKRFIEWKMRNI